MYSWQLREQSFLKGCKYCWLSTLSDALIKMRLLLRPRLHHSSCFFFPIGRFCPTDIRFCNLPPALACLYAIIFRVSLNLKNDRETFQCQEAFIFLHIRAFFIASGKIAIHLNEGLTFLILDSFKIHEFRYIFTFF